LAQCFDWIAHSITSKLRGSAMQGFPSRWSPVFWQQYNSWFSSYAPLTETQRHSIQQQWTRGHRKVMLIHTKVLAKEMEVVLHFFGSQFPLHWLYALKGFCCLIDLVTLSNGVHPDWNPIWL
jgi:hypothetical protein